MKLRLTPNQAVPLHFVQTFRAGDIGRQQIGRELHAPEAQSERTRQAAHEQRLGQTGNTDQ